MNYWPFVLMSTGGIILAVLLYVIVRWRKAPVAFKAMCFVASTSLAAGALAGVWGMHLIENRNPPAPAHTVSKSGRTSASSSHAGRLAVPKATPIAAATPASHAASEMSAGYVAQALGRKVDEGWARVLQGCRLGNYKDRSVRCRAATLAVHGWGDTGMIRAKEVVEFCANGYLPNAPALCWKALRGAFPSLSHSATEAHPSGIRTADIANALANYSPGYYGENGNQLTWSNLRSRCANGMYASRSPLCEAAAIHQGRRIGSSPVSYSVVASLCDVGLLRSGSEVCDAAYRSLAVRPFTVKGIFGS